MRSVSIVLLLAVVAIASAAPHDSNKPHYDLSNAEALFEDFIKKFNRNYKDESDREAHYRAFVASLDMINKLNEQNGSATFDINNFADFTEEDNKKIFGFNMEN